MAGFITPSPHPNFMNTFGSAARISESGDFQIVPNPVADVWYSQPFNYQTKDMRDCRPKLMYGPLTMGVDMGPIGNVDGILRTGVGKAPLRLVAASSNIGEVRPNDAVFLWAGDVVLKQTGTGLSVGAPPGLALTILTSESTIQVGDKVQLAAKVGSSWHCMDSIPVPVRTNAAGDIECASNDGVNCLWQSDMAGCDRVLANPGSNPLACGEAHKRLYGDTGYFSGHWCNKARMATGMKLMNFVQGKAVMGNIGVKIRLGEPKCDVTDLKKLCGADCNGFVYAEAPAVWAPLRANSQFDAQQAANVVAYAKKPAQATVVTGEEFNRAGVPKVRVEAFTVPDTKNKATDIAAAETVRARLADWDVVKTQYHARAIGWLSVLAIILASSTWIRSKPR